MKAHEHKSLLRVIICGSVQGAQNALMGRLLLHEVDTSAVVHAFPGREQGVTIDAAYRFFATDQRKFLVSDIPGCEQDTRNMITAGSTADAAVILIDARDGMLQQNRRHAYLASLIGIRHVALAVDKL